MKKPIAIVGKETKGWNNSAESRTELFTPKGVFIHTIETLFPPQTFTNTRSDEILRLANMYLAGHQRDMDSVFEIDRKSSEYFCDSVFDLYHGLRFHFGELLITENNHYDNFNHLNTEYKNYYRYSDFISRCYIYRGLFSLLSQEKATTENKIYLSREIENALWTAHNATSDYELFERNFKSLGMMLESAQNYSAKTSLDTVIKSDRFRKIEQFIASDAENNLYYENRDISIYVYMEERVKRIKGIAEIDYYLPSEKALDLAVQFNDLLSTEYKRISLSAEIGASPIESYSNRHNQNETAVEFYDRVWRHRVEAMVSSRDDINKADPKLLPALRIYCRNHPEIDKEDYAPPSKFDFAVHTLKTTDPASPEFSKAAAVIADHARNSKKQKNRDLEV